MYDTVEQGGGEVSRLKISYTTLRREGSEARGDPLYKLRPTFHSSLLLPLIQ